MIVTQDIQKNVISAIVGEYNRQWIQNSNNSTKQMAQIGINFMKLFQQGNSLVSFVKLNNKVCICLQTDLIKNKSKIVTKRVATAFNIASLASNDVLQIISFIKQLEDENYVIVINDFPKAKMRTINSISGEENCDNKVYINIHDSIFLDLIERYHYSRLIPTSALIDLFNNDYKTPEDIRFEQSQQTSRNGIIVAIAIGIFSLVATWLTSRCSLNKKDLINVEDALYENNSQMQDIQKVLDENNSHIQYIEKALDSIIYKVEQNSIKK